MASACDAVNEIKKRLCEKVGQTEIGTLAQLSSHDFSIFANDNLDQSKQLRLTVIGRADNSLHVTAIKVVTYSYMGQGSTKSR